MNIRTIKLLSMTIALSTFMGVFSLTGAEILWTGASTPSWSTGANWAGGVVPSANDVAVFDPVAQAITRWSVRLSANGTVAGIRFTNLTQSVTCDASGDFSLSIGSNGVSVAGADVKLAMSCALLADQRWTVAAGNELTLSGQLRGSARLTKSGAGRVWLTGDSAFSGTYRIEQGILKGAVFVAPVMDGLDVWMDAADISTLATNASGQVTNWVDKAGGQVMTPVGGGGGPRYGATLFNGRPGLRFDRLLNNGLLMASGYANTTNVVTAFVMMQRRIDQYAFAGLMSINKNGAEDYNTTSGSAFFRFPGSAPNYTLTCDRNNTQGGEINVPKETPVCLMSRFNGQSHTLVQDGVIPGRVSTDSRMVAAFNADRLILGNRPVANYTYPFNGDVAEVLVYNRVLTAAEELQVTEYLRAKWKPVETVEDVLKDAALWFDSSAVQGITTNALGGVTAWANLRSESSLVPSSTTTNAPAYIAANANGVPAVRFNKDVPNYLQNSGGYHNRGSALTFFASVTPCAEQNVYAGVASVSDGVSYDYNSNATAILIYLRDTTTGQQWSGHRNNVGLSYSYTAPQTPAVAMSRFDGAEHTFVVNGDVAGPTVASQGTFNANYFRLGDRIESVSRPFNGDVHEVLVFNRRLSPSAEKMVTEYLEAKWVATTNISQLLAKADLHLDASEASSILTNATGSVTNWTNIAGSSVMTVPTNGYSGPLLVEGAMNGLPVLRFSPAGSTALFMGEGYTNTAAQVNAFIVMRHNADQATDGGLLSIYAASGTYDFNNNESAILAYYPANGTIGGYRNGGVPRASITDIPYNAPVCLQTAFNGLAHTLSLNNGAVASSSYLGKFNSDRLCLGVRYENSTFGKHFAGDVAEMLIFNRMLSPSETQRITDYLTAKWLPQTAANELDPILQSAMLWLDASAAETMVTDVNGQITAWSNRLDNTAKALLPPSGLKGPTVLADGMNGRAVLRFDKDAATKQALMIDSGFALTGTATTAVIMMRSRAAQIANARLANIWKDNGDDHSSVVGGIYGYFPNATTITGHRAGGKSGFSPLPSETPTCIISRFDGSRHRMIKDVTLCAAAASTGAFNANRFGLAFRSGVSEWFNGDIAEVLVFNYALNPDQQRIVYEYMQNKWVKPASHGTLIGTQLIEINAGAELDVRDINGLTVQSAAKLSGAGRVNGEVTVASGGTVEAMVEGSDQTLAVSGDLTFASGSTVTLNYLAGAPLITVEGLLRLPSGITFSVSNLRESNRAGTIPVLLGNSWDNGSGGTPAAAGWTLSGAGGSTSFLLKEIDFSVNLSVIRGTMISFR
jgi:autotransporter-associated beta strand protein